MTYSECKLCGNTTQGFEIRACKKCKRRVGCYKAGGLFTNEEGCVLEENNWNSCPHCGNKEGYVFYHECIGEIE